MISNQSIRKMCNHLEAIGPLCLEGKMECCNTCIVDKRSCKHTPTLYRVLNIFIIVDVYRMTAYNSTYTSL